MNEKFMAIMSVVFIWIAVASAVVYIAFDISPVANGIILMIASISFLFALILSAEGWLRKK